MVKLEYWAQIIIYVLTFDHVHIVGSVSNGQSHCLFVLLYQTDHIGLLLWRDATADDRFTLACHVHEVDLWTPGLLLSLQTIPELTSAESHVDVTVPVSSPFPSRCKAVGPEGW